MDPASSSSTTSPEKYDVFLSFRGVDTRRGFTSHLHAALKREGIETFIDDDLDRGDKFLPALLCKIENSTISIVIFSKRYANSRSCLSELEHILECNNRDLKKVIPVFYNVEPADVKSQKNKVGKAFAELEGQFGEEIEGWRNALKEIASFSGFVICAGDKRTEAEVVDEVVKHVLEILERKSSNYNNNLIGTQSNSEAIESLLGIGSQEDRLIVGIWGMAGMGKTAIAKDVFYKIKGQFDNSCFVPDVREASKNGLNTLQLKLLSEILKKPNVDINSDIIKQQLRGKKVLIGLDNVTSVKQIEGLIGDYIKFFSLGSRIIVTTRDKQVLKSFNEPGCNIFIHSVEGLLQQDALKLFSRYAFGGKCPEDFLALSEEVVKYAKGVPLALKEFGRYLRKWKKGLWKSAIDKIQSIPIQPIRDELIECYEDLEIDQKHIFLDIACFFKWETQDLVIKFLEASGFKAEIEIDDLKDKCLISISDNKIAMNDLLRIMGWQIAQRQPSTDPGECRRLLNHRDICNVLQNNKVIGYIRVRGICLDMSEIKSLEISPDALANINNLVLFKLHNSLGEENNINKVQEFPRLQPITELTYLCWHGCPLKSLESNFSRTSLVVLDMSHSNVEFWKIDQSFANLKHVNLSHSKNLVKIIGLEHAPELENLILEGCTILNEICPSIECLNKLVMLNLRHCRSLKSLPDIFKLISLKDLNLSGCSELDQNELKNKIKGVLHKIKHPEAGSCQTLCICFPGFEIDECFTRCCRDSSITLKRHDNLLNKNIVSLALCAIVEYGKYTNKDQGSKVGYDFKHGKHVFHRGTLRSWDYGTGTSFVDSDLVFLCPEFHVPVPQTNDNNDDMTIQFYVKDLNGKTMDACKVKKCGFRLLQCQDVENASKAAFDKEEENEEQQQKRRKIG